MAHIDLFNVDRLIPELDSPFIGGNRRLRDSEELGHTVFGNDRDGPALFLQQMDRVRALLTNDPEISVQDIFNGLVMVGEIKSLLEGRVRDMLAQLA